MLILNPVVAMTAWIPIAAISTVVSATNPALALKSVRMEPASTTVQVVSRSAVADATTSTRATSIAVGAKTPAPPAKNVKTVFVNARPLVAATVIVRPTRSATADFVSALMPAALIVIVPVGGVVREAIAYAVPSVAVMAVVLAVRSVSQAVVYAIPSVAPPMIVPSSRPAVVGHAHVHPITIVVSMMTVPVSNIVRPPLVHETIVSAVSTTIAVPTTTAREMMCATSMMGLVLPRTAFVMIAATDPMEGILDSYNRWISRITLAFILAVFSISIGCSSSDSISCDRVEDCFDGEVCNDGICQTADDIEGDNHQDGEITDVGNEDTQGSTIDSGSTNGGDDDAGPVGDTSPEDTEIDHNAATEGDAGSEDTGANDTSGPVCQAGFSCHHGLGDVHEHAGGHFINWIEPVDDDYEYFACSVDEGFLELDAREFSARGCPNGDYRHRVKVRNCEDRNFAIDYELRSLEEACPLEEDIVDLSFKTHHPECDHDEDITSECHLVKVLDDGTVRWRAIFEASSNIRGWDPGFRMVVEPGVAFDYEVTVSVTDDPEPW